MTQSTLPYPLRVGVQIRPQHTAYKGFADAVRRVEDLGIDSIWNWDHFYPLFGDPQGNHFDAAPVKQLIRWRDTRRAGR